MPTPADLASLTATELAEAGLDLIVEHDGARLVISGAVTTEAEREAALDIADHIAGSVLQVDDSIEVTGAMPDEAGGADLSESDVAGFVGATPGLEDPESLMPGDFTDQPSINAQDFAQPEALSDDGLPLGEDISRAAEDGETYVPPIDPVGGNREIIGGFARSSLDSTDTERSSDGTYGDEAIHDAVARELREDAATTGLDLTIAVMNGVVTLTGTVEDIVDAENAEEVAARAAGVVEVIEALDVAGLDHERPARGD
ncbi:MAG: BON domain-containing protein [Dehalococcoidia bacterium]